MTPRRGALEGAAIHGFLRSLYGHRSNDAFRYGATLLLVGAISGVRTVLPLDTAPFLLYMPALFLVGVAFGRVPAVIGLAISTGFAPFFFYRSEPYGELSLSQIVAVVQFAVICFATVVLCDALRNLLAQNESAIGHGTTFTLRVPAALPGRAAPERPAA